MSSTATLSKARSLFACHTQKPTSPQAISGAALILYHLHVMARFKRAAPNQICHGPARAALPRIYTLACEARRAATQAGARQRAVNLIAGRRDPEGIIRGADAPRLGGPLEAG